VLEVLAMELLALGVSFVLAYSEFFVRVEILLQTLPLGML